MPHRYRSRGAARATADIARCQVCGSAEQLRRDHDHATGYVRGVLCHRCNVGLGYFLDSPALLRAAAAYVEDPPLIEGPLPDPAARSWIDSPSRVSP